MPITPFLPGQLDDDSALYTPRSMLPAIMQLPPVNTFLRDTFFGGRVFHDTPGVSFDFMRGTRKIAAYVNPTAQAKVVVPGGYETRMTRPAYIREKIAIAPHETFTRAIGENPYQASTPVQRAAALLGERLQILNDRLTRREEVMCAQAIFTGVVEVKGDGWDARVDFGYEDGVNIINLSGADLWDHGGDPMKQLDDWRLEIVQRCGIQPTHCIMGRKALWAFMNSPTVKEYLNLNFNRQFGSIAPTALPSGVSQIATLFLPTGVLQPFGYTDWYFDEELGHEVPMVPEDVCCLVSTEARADLHYGAIQNLNSLQAVPRFPWSWDEKDGSARWVQLEASPMPNIKQTDAYLVAHVVTA